MSAHVCVVQNLLVVHTYMNNIRVGKPAQHMWNPSRLRRTNNTKALENQFYFAGCHGRCTQRSATLIRCPAWMLTTLRGQQLDRCNSVPLRTQQESPRKRGCSKWLHSWLSHARVTPIEQIENHGRNTKASEKTRGCQEQQVCWHGHLRRGKGILLAQTCILNVCTRRSRLARADPHTHTHFPSRNSPEGFDQGC